MFHAHCTVESAQMLMSESQIISVHNTSEGILTYYRCHCGQIGFFVSRRDEVVEGHLSPPLHPPAQGATTVAA